MGIRFRCPNGHKLHVKGFLAGKRGLCPQCGVKLTIPLESDPAPKWLGKKAARAGRELEQLEKELVGMVDAIKGTGRDACPHPRLVS